MTTQPITIEGEHFHVEEIDPSLLANRKGAKKYLGLKGELCIACRACVDQCPWFCLFMVDSRVVDGEDSQFLVDDAIKDDEPRIIFWVDDIECTRCNICVERCPTDALSMDKLVLPGGSTRRRQLGTA